MAAVIHVRDPQSAKRLADLLNGNSRQRPVAVVTIPAGRETPWIDAGEVAREAGRLAEVYLIPTGEVSWEFSRHMPEGTQAYGGAGRVYPVGHAWTTDLRASPLHFAFDERDGEQATGRMVSDVFRMATAAGLLTMQPRHQLRPATGTVRLTVAGRALVDIGRQIPATVAEELTVTDLPIDRMLRPHMEVSGLYDPETNRLDVTDHLRGAEEALADYQVGDVVLARVARVRTSRAELVLFPPTNAPGVSVKVLRADVTTNPADDLRTLMTVGEIVPARVTATAPTWALVMHDVDDDEPVRAAPALLADGPAWLVEESPEPLPALEVPRLPERSEPPAPLPPAPEHLDNAGTLLAEVDAEQEDSSAPAPTPPRRPSPAMFDRNRPSPPRPVVSPPPVAAPSPVQHPDSTRTLLLTIDGLKAEVARVRRGAEDFRTHLAAALDEAAQLRYLLHQAEREASRAEHDLRTTRAKLRKAGNSKASATVEEPRFADPNQGFRHLVTTRWAIRTLPVEQADRPLADYTVGEGFLASVEALSGVRVEKVADVVVEIVTGLAPHLPSREVHRLRSGPGPEDPPRTRSDGAVAWRAQPAGQLPLGPQDPLLDLPRRHHRTGPGQHPRRLHDLTRPHGSSRHESARGRGDGAAAGSGTTSVPLRSMEFLPPLARIRIVSPCLRTPKRTRCHPPRSTRHTNGTCSATTPPASPW